jgi:hypothetical protein
LVERYLAKVQVDGSNPLARSNLSTCINKRPLASRRARGACRGSRERKIRGGFAMSDALSWNGNWAWALPLIVLTLLLHVVGLALINVRMVRMLNHVQPGRGSFPMFVSVMGITALLAILLLAFEAILWAAAYRSLGALPDGRTALLYSLNAFTAYGHTELALAPHWRLMGALEALNGMLLFGLTTGFLYGHFRRVWPVELTPPPVPDKGRP